MMQHVQSIGKMMTKALQKQLKAIFNHEILTTAKELQLQMSTKLAESWKSKVPCKGTYNCFSSGITHTILAIGMTDLENFHSIVSSTDSLTNFWGSSLLTSLA